MKFNQIPSLAPALVPQQTHVDHIILWTETSLANVFSYGEVRAPGSLVSMRFSLDAPVEGHFGQPVTALVNPNAPTHRICVRNVAAHQMVSV